MLQQTQVARVIPKWEAFLAAFPTVEACALAPQADVVRLWAGLGYHRRAVNLHRMARAVVEEFDGEFPRGLASLRSLPGIGAYTARAVQAFAFELDAAVVDTNVGRIVARAVTGHPCSGPEAQRLADALAPPGLAWRWNQAMLDLGATVCTKRSPDCADCPVHRMCTWFSVGLVEPDPAVGSAAVSSGQSRFDGSDRQGRGRLLDALRSGPVHGRDLADVMGWADDRERAARVAETLLLDGLVSKVGDIFTLA